MRPMRARDPATVRTGYVAEIEKKYNRKTDALGKKTPVLKNEPGGLRLPKNS